MAYIDISNFKFGLDTRRSELTSLPGSLLTLENGHINQGGEVENRLAFVKSKLPANCFGLETTSIGLVTFGSIADPGGWPIGGVSAYQRLQHPAVLDGATFDAQYHAMTAIVWSYAFLGRAYACATFADGRSFLYYNGTIVSQSRNGLALPGWTTQQTLNNSLELDVINEFVAVGWQGIYNAGKVFTGANPTFEADGFVGSPAAITWLASDTVNSTLGGLSYSNEGAVGAIGAAGTASFTVNGVLGDTYTINGFRDLAGAIAVEICTTSVWATSNNATASALAGAINRRTLFHGISAQAGGAVVTLTNPLLAAPNTFPYTQNYTWPSITVASTDATANGVKAFSASIYSRVAIGQQGYVQFWNTWAVGDNFTSIITPGVGSAFTIGKGRISGTSPINGAVFQQRVYLAEGNQFNFSAVGDPTGWETQNTTSSFLPYSSQYGVQDTVQAFADYQGRLAVFGRRSVQIWLADANPASFALQQTLTNIGTFAPLSVQSLGELDVFFLSDTGVRSLRVRDSSLNAFVNDLGSPIDSLIQAALVGYGSGNLACAQIEPTQNRYWLWLKDTIYTLSYFPSNKIVGWSTYLPQYPSQVVFTVGAATNGSITITGVTTKGVSSVIGNIGIGAPALASTIATSLAASINSIAIYTAVAVGATVTLTPSTGSSCIATPSLTGDMTCDLTSSTMVTFAPQKFSILNGKLYIRDSDSIYVFGGDTGIIYDTSVCTAQIPFLGGGGRQERPGTNKVSKGIDFVLSGTWAVSAGMDWVSGTLSPVATLDQASYDGGTIPFVGSGTHFSMKAVTTKIGPSKLSSLMFHYELAQETA